MQTYPKNGLLSGMIITALAGVFVVITGCFLPDLAAVFEGKPSGPLLDSFFVSICLMTAHKIESYFTGEYDVCPVYLNNGQARWSQNSREATFLAFVPTFLGMLFLLYLALKGSPWSMMIFVIWAAQGLHEFHHIGKTAAQKSYYSGVVTAVLFTAHIDVFVFPAWLAQLKSIPGYWLYIFYGVQPFVLLAFFVEHRGWLRKAEQLKKAQESTSSS